jgi:hypothetical protein
MDTAEETLDLQGVATLLKAEPETIAQYARTGELPGTKMGKSWVFLRGDVIAFLRQRIVQETEMRRGSCGEPMLATQPSAVIVPSKQRTRRTVLPPLPQA